MSELTCKQRIAGELKSRIEDLTILWNAYTGQDNQPHNEDGNVEGGDLDGAHIYEYGLSFDYVPAEGRKRGYFRYQISWGGPSDEFRFFAEGNGYNWHVDRIEYVFMDWFDGAKRTLSGSNFELLREIFESLFVEVGSAESEFNKAYED